MNIIITGASGFIGGFIVEKALDEGLSVFAAVRSSSSKKYLQDKRIKFIELNFARPEVLSEQLGDFMKSHGNIDYLVHNAGVTKSLTREEYNLVNFTFAKNLIDALRASSHQLKKFVFVSSLAASGPGAEHSDEPIKVSDPCRPVTEYGRSKLKTEQYLTSLQDFPYVIMRPPAVFGPRDADMFSFFQLIQNKLELYIGGNLQYLSFIYVKDLAAAIVKATTSSVKQKIYFISDNHKYTNVLFSERIKHRMAKKTFVIKLPLFLVHIVARVTETVGKLTQKPSPLNVDKINELKCSNWLCDSSDFYDDTGFKAQYTLDGGIDETINWYKKENWL